MGFSVRHFYLFIDSSHILLFISHLIHFIMGNKSGKSTTDAQAQLKIEPDFDFTKMFNREAGSRRNSAPERQSVDVLPDFSFNAMFGKEDQGPEGDQESKDRRASCPVRASDASINPNFGVAVGPRRSRMCDPGRALAAKQRLYAFRAKLGLRAL